MENNKLRYLFAPCIFLLLSVSYTSFAGETSPNIKRQQDEIQKKQETIKVKLETATEDANKVVLTHMDSYLEQIAKCFSLDENKIGTCIAGAIKKMADEGNFIAQHEIGNANEDSGYLQSALDWYNIAINNPKTPEYYKRVILADIERATKKQPNSTASAEQYLKILAKPHVAFKFYEFKHLYLFVNSPPEGFQFIAHKQKNDEENLLEFIIKDKNINDASQLITVKHFESDVRLDTPNAAKITMEFIKKSLAPECRKQIGEQIENQRDFAQVNLGMLCTQGKQQSVLYVRTYMSFDTHVEIRYTVKLKENEKPEEIFKKMGDFINSFAVVGEEKSLGG